MSREGSLWLPEIDRRERELEQRREVWPQEIDRGEREKFLVYFFWREFVLGLMAMYCDSVNIFRVVLSF